MTTIRIRKQEKRDKHLQQQNNRNDNRKVNNTDNSEQAGSDSEIEWLQFIPHEMFYYVRRAHRTRCPFTLDRR